MPPDRSYLTTSVEEARKQILRRIRARPQISSDWDDWNNYNLDLLRRLFTTTELADRYAAKIKSTKYIGEAFLQEVVETLNLYIRPAGASPPAKPLTTPPQPISRSEVSQPASRWEFHSTIVADPAMPGAEGPFNMEDQLKSLAEQGWELVAAAPARRNKRPEGTFTDFYRLFFKRPASR